ncbi:hypothetical protein GXW82_22435 [Streptacidiphilus sp. 4-A2]|nr:hypothetical protein [Streptacidiphilus sp. 4-A2]
MDEPTSALDTSAARRSWGCCGGHPGARDGPVAVTHDRALWAGPTGCWRWRTAGSPPADRRPPAQAQLMAPAQELLPRSAGASRRSRLTRVTG